MMRDELAARDVERKIAQDGQAARAGKGLADGAKGEHGAFGLRRQGVRQE